jgi:ubiquinol-cytochrome c reductase iron-sulfur subunit
MLFDGAVAAELNELEIDLAGIQPDQQILVKAAGSPIIIWRRRPEAIRRAAAMPATLRYPEPDTARALRPDWLVVIATCPHSGCLITTDPLGEATWACPCCASRFDASGRVTSGPAQANLTVPVYAFAGEFKLLLRVPVVARG